MDVMSEVRKNSEYIVNLRREFHRHPELSMKEFNTAARIRKELEALNIPYETVGETGTVGILKGKNEKPVIGLRCDIDALPITELTDVEYKSENEGVMHDCGHDGHISMLMTAAKVISEHRDELPCTVKFIFQPSEERMTGAEMMLASGLLDDIDAVGGMHLLPHIDAGKISVEAGPRYTAAAFMKIKIIGKAGHGAMPHYSVDPIYVGAKVVDALQSIASRETNPSDSVVVSICTFHCGRLNNIIDECAELTGTIRTFTPSLRNELPHMIERIIKSTCEAHRATYELEYEMGVPPTINDAHCSEVAAGSVRKILGEEGLTLFQKTPGGEDFAFILEKIPGVYAFVGCRNEEKDCIYPLHHDHFNLDEDCLVNGAAFYVQYLFDMAEDIKNNK